MEERKAPSPEERIQHREIDPSAYSLSSNSKLVSESFDETNEIQSWSGGNTDSKAWKDIWGSGQGIGRITDSPSVSDLVDRLKAEYLESAKEFQNKVNL